MKTNTNKDTIRNITQIVMHNDWTTPRRLQMILRDENIKSILINDYFENKYVIEVDAIHGDNVTIKAVYYKEDNETHITIVTVYQNQCTYCEHGSCIMENIPCDGYGKCKVVNDYD